MFALFVAVEIVVGFLGFTDDGSKNLRRYKPSRTGCYKGFHGCVSRSVEGNLDVCVDWSIGPLPDPPPHSLRSLGRE
jgi:hypothetical protein